MQKRRFEFLWNATASVVREMINLTYMLINKEQLLELLEQYMELRSQVEAEVQKEGDFFLKSDDSRKAKMKAESTGMFCKPPKVMKLPISKYERKNDPFKQCISSANDAKHEFSICEVDLSDTDKKKTGTEFIIMNFPYVVETSVKMSKEETVIQSSTEKPQNPPVCQILQMTTNYILKREFMEIIL